MKEFALNRKQLKKITDIADRFDNVEWFVFVEENTSGIGPTVLVKFNLFGDNDKDADTTVDITDVSTW